MSLTATLKAIVSATLTGTNDLGTPSFPLSYTDTIALANGTGADQADLIFTDQRTLSASANEDLDLAGSLTDPLGSTLTFVTIKAIVVKAADGNTNNVEVSPAAANGFLGPFGDASDKVSVKPDGVFMIVAPETGWTVTAGTGDLLNFANSGAGTSVTYDVIFVGTSA